MIQIAGSAERSFVFPAGLPLTYAFLGDVQRSFRYLPHISVATSYSGSQFRLRYSALEASIYHVFIYCDVQVISGRDPYLMTIQPLLGKEAVKSSAHLNSMTCQGYYESSIEFHESGDQTRVDYSIQLNASLPIPLTLRFVPPALLRSASQNILQLRMDEVIGGFVDRSIQAYAP